MEVTTGAALLQISARDIEERSAANGEPAWLRERRMTAWRTWERLPLPDRETQLEWRRTDPETLNLNVVPQSADGAPRSASGGLEPLAVDASFGAVLRFVDGRPVAQMMCAEAAEQNVRVLPFAEALRELPDVLERAFMTESVAADESKWAALHAALTDGGAVVYVPRGVEVAEPVLITQELTEGSVAAFPHLLIYAEAESKITVIGESYSEGTGYALIVPVVEVIARNGAEANYVDLQRWGDDVFVMPQLRAVTGRDAHTKTTVIALGGGTVKGNVGVHLAEEGGQGDLLGVLFPSGEQHFELDTMQLHAAPHTTSSLTFRTALEDHGTSISNGMVRIEPAAQKSDAFQENRNLVLSEGAKADPIPALEILANDVRCSHGTTVGPIDEDQAFYIQCRGLPHGEAERLIVHGFFQQVLDRIPSVVEGRVNDEIESKIASLLAVKAGAA